MGFSFSRREWLAGAALAALGGAAGAATNKLILVLGDSLSAEYGLKRGSGWVALLTQRLAAEHLAYEVVNASISGETSAGGRSRIEALLEAHHPSQVIIELGGNDALRGLPLAMTEDNLAAIGRASLNAGARVLLIGIQVPPNYGADYSAHFAAAFEHVSRSLKVALVPFLLKGIADGPDAARMFQADRIHPIAQAHPAMLDNVWPELRKLLK
jgi:acyl-CoA thioesterase-1